MPPFQIRQAELDDIPGLHELSLAVIRDGRGVVFTLEDAQAQGPRTGARVAESIAPATRDDALVLVAVADGRIVGYASVHRVKPTFARHVGVFSTEVHPEFQRRGIGRALMRGSLQWAQARGIERFELYTRADNERARALYESEGFTEESKRMRFIRLPDGRYVDDIVYVRFL
jgi:ribosomal protein S18 acetylase RimI-like enzyme